jgi:hypothetical protein
VPNEEFGKMWDSLYKLRLQPETLREGVALGVDRAEIGPILENAAMHAHGLIEQALLGQPLDSGPVCAELRRFSDLLAANPGEEETGPLELLPNGFAYMGKDYRLTGRPRQILEALLKAPHQKRYARELCKDLQIDEDSVDYPEQVIRDATTDLRKMLRTAIQDAGQNHEQPLPSSGRGTSLAYQLDLPKFFPK